MFILHIPSRKKLPSLFVLTPRYALPNGRGSAAGFATTHSLRSGLRRFPLVSPFLPSSGCRRSSRQFGPLPGAVFTIDLESRQAAWQFIDRLQVIRRATNLFDRKSLAIHPASTIFGLFSPLQRAEMSVADTTVRLSIGLEAREDLLSDIRNSLPASE